ncbi:hypothetical protein CTAYLR_002451 [Chrysophaeum taylorii]|uniref:Uncharacterized protein n=1 Tax=Chrysophaeum taylorii TaxID=2483200 RepID=A0AAD7XQY7_9STRA|nr:hypothetical protein CTAYLR_002451 [Chrysophaeum taylorii]
MATAARRYNPYGSFLIYNTTKGVMTAASEVDLWLSSLEVRTRAGRDRDVASRVTNLRTTLAESQMRLARLENAVARHDLYEARLGELEGRMRERAAAQVATTKPEQQRERDEGRAARTTGSGDVVVSSAVERAARLRYGPSLSVLNPAAPVVDEEVASPPLGTWACDGSPTAAIFAEGGHSLGEFTLLIAIKSDRGCVEEGWHKQFRAFVDYEEEDPDWYIGGCPLFNAIYARWPAATWKKEWRQRRRCCPMRPEEEFEQTGGMTEAAISSRGRARDALFRGPRSDFGLTLSPKGGLLFGAGHRDFAFRVRHGRPVREVTLEAREVEVVDGTWHTIAAVRRKRRSFGGTGSPPDAVDEFQDDVLELYVDGRRVDRGVSIRATRLASEDARDDAVAAAAAACAARQGNNTPSCAGLEPHELVDATHFVALGQLFRGCVRGAQIRRSALDAAAIADWHATLELPETCSAPEKHQYRPPPPRRLPVYYLAHADNGSRAMRDDFVASIERVDQNVDLREFLVHSKQTAQIQRYGPKGNLIQRALREALPGDFVVVSDLDVRVFKPIEPIVRSYARARDVDVVFQRDEDWSLVANLGFMALRSTPEVAEFFRVVAEMATNYSQGLLVPGPGVVLGGDQRIVNAALKDPRRIPTLPVLKWALFPTEIMTRSISQQRGLLYANEALDVLFHVNDFGGNAIAPEKARTTKIALLNAAESRVRKHASLPVAHSAPRPNSEHNR